MAFLPEHDRYSMSTVHVYYCYWMHRIFIGMWVRYDLVYRPLRCSLIMQRALDDNYYASLPISESETALYRAAGFDP